MTLDKWTKEAAEYVGEKGLAFDHLSDQDVQGKTEVVLLGENRYTGGLFPFKVDYGTSKMPLEDFFEYFTPYRGSFILELVGFGQENKFIKTDSIGIFANSLPVLESEVMRYWDGEQTSAHGKLKYFVRGAESPYVADKVIEKAYKFFYPILESRKPAVTYRPYTIEELVGLVDTTFVWKKDGKDYVLSRITVSKGEVSLQLINTYHLNQVYNIHKYVKDTQEFFDDFIHKNGCPAGVQDSWE